MTRELCYISSRVFLSFIIGHIIVITIYIVGLFNGGLNFIMKVMTKWGSVKRWVT